MKFLCTKCNKEIDNNGWILNHNSIFCLKCCGFSDIKISSISTKDKPKVEIIKDKICVGCKRKMAPNLKRCLYCGLGEKIVVQQTTSKT
jgi:hypothetical protein